LGIGPTPPSAAAPCTQAIVPAETHATLFLLLARRSTRRPRSLHNPPVAAPHARAQLPVALRSETPAPLLFHLTQSGSHAPSPDDRHVPDTRSVHPRDICLHHRSGTTAHHRRSCRGAVPNARLSAPLAANNRAPLPLRRYRSRHSLPPAPHSAIHPERTLPHCRLRVRSSAVPGRDDTLPPSHTQCPRSGRKRCRSGVLHSTAPPVLRCRLHPPRSVAPASAAPRLLSVASARWAATSRR